ncbi:MAG: coproporphyrinogen III oxidase family protein, partial [bacterium]|nr:coproporphyrinogen III oxidase family protein [bacterium]
SYLYSYPHKSAYRPMEPVDLRALWKKEKRESLFLYYHIPYCRSRCAYCNLLSLSNPLEGFIGRYVETLERQARTISGILGEHRFSAFAIGGGTPTLLSTADLEKLFFTAGEILGAELSAIPVSVEVSPKTVPTDKLTLLKQMGTTRVSIGIQSFVEEEARALHRVEQEGETYHALERIVKTGFPFLNIDLIYGIPGQTEKSWLFSLEKALSYSPEEIYLYPLYIRPLTALNKQTATRRKSMQEADIRMELYKTGRDFLKNRGYRQLSMRHFVSTGYVQQQEKTDYSCQEDGMVGMGCGARSYTGGFHYSSFYAVSRKGIAQ